jgi:glucan phosphoethanolaminetransferase (alkaline phosphatase superfamily)
MEKTILIITKVFTYLIMALAAVFMIWIWSVGDDAIETDAALADRILSPNMTLTFVSLVVAVALAILLPAAGMLRNPKQAIRALIVVAGMAVLGFICYSIAGNEYPAEELTRLEITAETSKLVGAGLYFTYITGAITILVTIISGISGALKKV